ncbi:unnamed protein product [Clonostachys solani]|uniref:2EXR domain-containing protein n=1 Tax=Clonostachys solani TaxID=160281 RepID=A0A9N9ZPV4_9HYPO|nr:unnamed protein product [Clonostachys solani]
MASFHFFPDLPYELRHQIWQQAIRPSAKKCSGIQHFSILHSNMKSGNTASKPKVLPSYRGVSTSCDKRTAFAAEIPGAEAIEANRSAYMWDAGLWTACWESRQIILRHWEMKKWSEKRRKFLSDGITFGWGEEMWRENQDFCITINAPSLTTNDGGEEWQLMVRPYEDAFYFDPSSLVDALKQPSPLPYDDNLFEIMQQLPFSGVNYGCQPVQHFIFDFDPNWLNNLPRWDAHLDSDSPQGFIIDLLWKLARRETEFHIWLIDRSLRQSSIKNGDKVLPTGVVDDDARVFYNCDEEFVDLGKAGYEHFDRPWMLRDEKKLSAALAREENGFAGWFIWWLAENLNETLSEVKSYPDKFDDSTFESFWVEDHISILGYRR